MTPIDKDAPQARRTEIGTAHRPVARPAQALRAQALARQGSADRLRREHAARRAVRARRRHPGPRAGRRLRPGPGRANVLEEKRLELVARGHPPPSRNCATSISGAAACRSRYPRTSDSMARGRSRGQRIATTYPYMLERYLQERNFTPRSSRCRARSRSRRAWGAPTSSATSSPPVRHCRPITCAKWTRCSRATRC